MKQEIVTNIRNSKQLISALRRYRKLRHFTQVQLGQSAGVPQTTVSKVEIELIDPSLTTLFKLLAALDLELSLKPRKKALSLYRIALSHDHFPSISIVR